ncbi:acetyl/propionyl/methylcrotonyl-CoA carboxylase subunit alpha [Acidocella aromatica]|uniref:Propionyl-CoA carboxylase alpha chain/3-methylcrotonyl-CoA carboxylase alpha subunit n=1 Tax=Acidocella aromatica TaxID=1303579 RepID=A0A840VCF8_9PROT|nr:acetyl/propionyl/methylcrotonyl-CoA carboxylase subunit alpha [Acidocella aromatica]MBB5373344.1 propionyl-CoA carboxylase alpha chain/3-methylcrotonyl-CoA carboxylase alpha subunit [Acidocella aromatica]
MFSSLLIANRGEIARRVIRTASRLGIRTIAVYSEADAAAPFVAEADEAILIGPAPARESYLRPEKLLEAARLSGAEAIHPGYGFLSENAEFAQAVIDVGLIWVGPKPSSIRAMGLKDAAKALMQQAGVPVTPGYLGEDQSEDRLAAEAARIGFPLLIKAVAGGGGKGMRKVERLEDFAAALASCKREAASSFGDDRVLLEIYVTRPRHIEVQVFGDAHGNVVHLYERDCSLQRRHQKVIEEAPAPGMSPEVREAVCAAAVQAARAVDYQGAGTIEFIADASEGLRAERIWFMEMNTRLQVEHPVTEAITGQDLVEWQLRVAAGEPLPLSQEQIPLNGHAIEARLYAENPDTGFLPSTGPLTHFVLPEAGVRVDSAVEQGGEVTAFYDPMIAKLIAHGPTRAAAAKRLEAACASVQVWPVKTNAAFLARTLRNPSFRGAALDTGFIEAHLPELLGRAEPDDKVLRAAATARLAAHATPQELLGFRLNAPPRVEARLQHGGETHVVALSPGVGSSLPVTTLGDETVVFEQGRAFAFTEVSADDTGHGGGESGGAVLSPMPGHILSVAVAMGDAVKKGAPLLVMEAMKMEMTLTAPCDGTIAELNAAPGARVAEGVLLLRLETGD